MYSLHLFLTFYFTLSFRINENTSLFYFLWNFSPPTIIIIAGLFFDIQPNQQFFNAIRNFICCPQPYVIANFFRGILDQNENLVGKFFARLRRAKKGIPKFFFSEIGILSAKVYTKKVPNFEKVWPTPGTLRPLTVKGVYLVSHSLVCASFWDGV